MKFCWVGDVIKNCRSIHWIVINGWSGFKCIKIISFWIVQLYCIYQASLQEYRYLLYNVFIFSPSFILQLMLSLSCIPSGEKIFPKSIKLIVASISNFDSVFSCFRLRSPTIKPYYSLSLESDSHSAKLGRASPHHHLHYGQGAKQQVILAQCKVVRLSLAVLLPCYSAFV